MYDFNFMEKVLTKIGFDTVCWVGVNNGNVPKLLIDDACRQSESLYVEAVVGNGYPKAKIVNS